MRGTVSLYGAALAAIFIGCSPPGAVGQDQTPPPIRIDVKMAHEAIRAESNLVLIPVYVYDKDIVREPILPFSSEATCMEENGQTFNRLLPTQAWLPKPPLGVAEDGS